MQETAAHSLTLLANLDDNTCHQQADVVEALDPLLQERSL